MLSSEYLLEIIPREGWLDFTKQSDLNRVAERTKKQAGLFLVKASKAVHLGSPHRKYA